MKNSTINQNVVKETEFSFDDEPPSSQVNLINKNFVSIKKIDSAKIVSEETIKPSVKSIQFINKYFPEVRLSEWNDWHWQIRNSIKSTGKLKEFIELSDFESRLVSYNKDSLPLRITPYYASLIENTDENNPVRRSVVPSVDELLITHGEASDPLHENSDSPVPNLIHRYPDRVLFLITGFCSTYCRYCTRSHMVAKEDKCHFGTKDLEAAFNYIESHSEVRDVLLSGGDPLTMSDEKIDYILSRIKSIPHVEMIRIGTKVPVVLPQRITISLVNILKKHHPLFLSIHFTHPEEITSEVKEACERLANAGIPLGSQTVLLKNINNDVATMKKLVHELLKIRVKPYYLYQCDPILGSSHFRTPVENGLEIIKGLRGFTSGYAIPNYVIDAPGGGGKIPLLPEYYLGKENGDVLLRNFEDKIFRYPDYV
jgi:lysine 2,3-aminomutase